ncbi:unnamed protein product [Linum trigynum]|uniref:Uncharacterized protein n=1 Tax=Linum trigynum TaxID=586398 RepID=A0AAV2EV94_9ROSI
METCLVQLGVRGSQYPSSQWGEVMCLCEGVRAMVDGAASENIWLTSEIKTTMMMTTFGVLICSSIATEFESSLKLSLMLRRQFSPQTTR